MKNYENPSLSPEERARDLLAELSIDEKMAQVNSVFPFDAIYQDYEEIGRLTPCGIGEVSTLEMRRFPSLDQAAGWQRKVQEIVMANSPHHIPAIFHMEGLCGPFIQEGVSLPSGIGRGSTFDPELEEKIGAAVARQELASGITHILAPVLDIARDSRMGRQGEAYGEDPTLASAMGAAYTKGAQGAEEGGRRADCVAKHFLAFHNSEAGIHGAVSDTPARLLQEVYAKPFQAAIAKSDLRGIMPCYCAIDGEPVHASKRLLTNLLRDRMGFDGLSVSDYGSVGNAHDVQKVGETSAIAGAKCMSAGLDIEMPSCTGYNDELKEMFLSGQADIAILDRAVQRVLTAKFRMGLFEHPFAEEGEKLHQVFRTGNAKELSLQAARESLVLLKNDGVLPLSEKKIHRLALVGPHADSARKFFGGYTHLCMVESTYAVANSIAGVAGSVQADPEDIVTVPGTHIQSDETPEFDRILKLQKPDCKSLLEQLRETYPDMEIVYAYGYPIAGEDTSGFEDALNAIRGADAAILTLGGKHGTCSMATMGEGVDASDINLPPCQDRFLEEAAKLGVPLVGVHFNGRPISSDAADRCLNAILEAWNPAECGAQAIQEVLFGDIDPSGRMPVTTARNAGQIPIYYNHPNGSSWHQSGSIGFADYVDLPHTPRYYFGQGLSYTTFEYAGLEVFAKEEKEGLETESGEKQDNVGKKELVVSADGEAVIRFTVENTGNREGIAVPQLYLSDEYADMIRPVQELAGFARVRLLPGEKKQVSFTVSPSQMAYLDRNMEFCIEKGRILVHVGASSEDIRLEGAFRIADTKIIESRERKFYADALIER